MRFTAFFLCVFFLATLFFSPLSASPSHRLSPFRAYGSVQEWSPQQRSNPDQLFTLTFFLKQKNLDLLHEVHNSVTNPQSPMYGQYLTNDDLFKMTAVPESIEAVRAFLAAHNAADLKVYQSGDSIRAKLPIGTIERVFGATMMDYVHPTTKKVISRTEQYKLPSEIAGHVEFVSHLNHFPSATPFSASRHTAKKVSLAELDQHNNVSPATLNSVYHISSNVVTNQGATQAVFEDDQQSFDYADLAHYNQLFGISPQNITFITGVNQPTSCSANPNDCVESMLDVEVIMAVAQKAPTSFYGIDENDPQPFVDFLTELLNDPNAPLVSSVSYGEIEPQVPSSIYTQFNAVIQKVNAKGMSIVISSGDDGANGVAARGNVPAGCGLAPSYPASSPFVTAVGASQGPELNPPGPEIVCSSSTNGLITSGGGFSTIWPAQPYQTSVVQAYLSSGNSSIPPSNQFNGANRGYPDVTLLGHNYYDAVGGQVYLVSGTSASAPAFAGMLTLINNARLNAGKKQVGFANPALYQAYAKDPTIFNDITNGLNNCPVLEGAPSQQCCPYGFPATQGWDAVTGLGSVNFSKLLKYFLSLP